MHGLINRGIQRFVVDSYGEDTWHAVMKEARFSYTEFEAMWIYDDDDTLRVLAAASKVLNRPREEILEDIGTYLVSHPNVYALRRLLRFGGVTFVEFLHSLDDLPDRARLAVADLDLPRLELFDVSRELFMLRCHSDQAGWGFLFMGILRALADDYGALAFLEYKGRKGSTETLEIALLETQFADGKDFVLGAHLA